jgi:hypothetical protein
MRPYSTISLAIYGSILNLDVPSRPYPSPTSFPVPQIPSVDDMLSGAAWKDMPSSAIGGPGPYIPKLLLGIRDTQEQREARLRTHEKERRAQEIRNGLLAVEMLRKEGLITEQVAAELESKVEDDEGKSVSNPAEIAFINQIGPLLIAGLSNVSVS